MRAWLVKRHETLIAAGFGVSFLIVIAGMLAMFRDFSLHGIARLFF